MRARRNSVRSPRRFLPPNLKGVQIAQGGGFRKVFPEGHWTTIQINLELNGWKQSQIQMIRNLMNNGWSMSQALNQVSLNIGRCPIRFRKTNKI